MAPSIRPRVRVSRLSWFLPAALLATACGGGNGQEARAGHNGSDAAGRPQQPAVPVAVGSATTGSIATYYTATASLAPEREAEVLSRVAGLVKQLLCEEGDAVREGDPLLLIDNDEYLYRLRQAEAERADVESRLARLEEMRSRDLVSAEEYESLKNDLKTAEANEGLARLNVSYTRVTAPFTGRVTLRRVERGQNVSVGTPLFVLADFEPLLARVHVPAKEFAKLAPDQPVQLVLESSGERLAGRIKLVSPVIDATSGTIKVTVEVSHYPPTVRPGDFAQVRIVTERRESATLVPKIALVVDRGERVLFVAADSTAERRVVEVGFEDDVNAEIQSGLAPGERVVVKGQRSLKHGQVIKILESGEVAGDTTAQDGS
ncbi:MAG: efflux RND transporter periplasmic adaptor subunit [Candidatus Krumholzibacteria bacterium]|nr:efflux RND transporter periplasmic adaptor subunit [Candidatus Krumholzibacteria bacterium]